MGGSCSFFTCGYKSIKQRLLSGRFCTHVLRVPLDADTESVIFQFDALYKTVGAFCGNDESVADLIDGLMVHAVDRDRRLSEYLKQVRALFYAYRVCESGTGQKIHVLAVLHVFDVLKKSSSKISVQHLNAAANP